MNDNPHLLAIVESKLSQARTHLRHESFEKAEALMNEVRIYTDALNFKTINH